MGERDSSEELDLEERRTLVNELVLVRQAIQADRETHREILEQLQELRRGQEQHGREFGQLKDHMTREALANQAASVEPNGLTGKRVLIVEDEISLLRMAETALRKLGCIVVGSPNRTDAEQRLADGQFDVALVDLHLPSSSEGVELCRWITRLYPSTGLVVMSGRFEQSDLDDFMVIRVEKPFSLLCLHDAIEEAIGGPATANTDRAPAPPFGLEPTTLQSVGDDEPDTSAETPEALAAAAKG